MLALTVRRKLVFVPGAIIVSIFYSRKETKKNPPKKMQKYGKQNTLIYENQLVRTTLEN
jgi:hypothetical protein